MALERKTHLRGRYIPQTQGKAAKHRRVIAVRAILAVCTVCLNVSQLHNLFIYFNMTIL